MAKRPPDLPLEIILLGLGVFLAAAVLTLFVFPIIILPIIIGAF